ncbi:MAG: hypothetical protein RLO48_19240 [Bauldia litoralis]
MTMANALSTNAPSWRGRVTLEERLAEMRIVLSSMKQATMSETLRMLRERFPDVPLRQRIQEVSRLNN